MDQITKLKQVIDELHCGNHLFQCFICKKYFSYSFNLFRIPKTCGSKLCISKIRSLARTEPIKQQDEKNTTIGMTGTFC